MNLFHKLKASASRLSVSVLVPAIAAFTASPAFAFGFQKANTVMQNISTGLHGLAAITITVAVIWVGYKTLWVGESLRQCAYIIIGGILIGGGSEIGALLTS
ncbi:TrbC/VirB2 family protein [Salmonella enterica subsp. enterica serovar Newport]|nr:TrbC/VirB2 family protein [Salmonella enterica subsp. enterica serovar Newport]